MVRRSGQFGEAVVIDGPTGIHGSQPDRSSFTRKNFFALQELRRARPSLEEP